MNFEILFPLVFPAFLIFYKIVYVFGYKIFYRSYFHILRRIIFRDEYFDTFFKKRSLVKRIQSPIALVMFFWIGVKKIHYHFRIENDERLNGDLKLKDRLWRGSNREPSWDQVEFWRERWNKDLVRNVIDTIGSCKYKDELKEKIENLTHFSEDIGGQIDLRGFDTSVLKNKRGERIIIQRSLKNEEWLDLSNVSFEGARLTDLNLHNCNLSRVNFRKATLRNVDFSNSCLTKANLEDADLRNACVSNAQLGYIKFSWDSWRFQGTIFREGFLKESATIDPVLEKCSNEQSYFYIMKHRADWLGRVGWRLWYWTSNFGRSFRLWFWWTMLVISFFGSMYSFSSTWEVTTYHKDVEKLSTIEGISNSFPCKLEDYWPPKLKFSFPEHDKIAYYYFSIVVFTTLGFGDIFPMNAGAQILVMIEVVIGYIMLGLLINVLSNYLKPN